MIEREIPKAGNLGPADLKGIAAKSCGVLGEMNRGGTDIQWVHSYVTDDKIYCGYNAPNEEAVRLHAQRGGFPAKRIERVREIIDPTTADWRVRRTRFLSFVLLAAAFSGCVAPSPRSIPPAQGSVGPPVVDHHQHFFSPPLARLVTPDPLPPGGVAVEAIDADRLIAMLDSAGIQRALVLALGYSWGNPGRNVENVYEKVKAENDWVAAQVARYPDRLRAFCSFNPLHDYALDELARCGANPHLRHGLKLHIGNSRVSYHDARHRERLREVFRAVNERRIPIVIHMRSSHSAGLPYGREEARIFFDSLLPAAPDIPIQIAHLAGSGGYDATTDSALSVFTDAIARQDPRTNQLWFDVTTVDRSATPETAKLIATRIRQLGIQRILYGSDAATGGNLPPRQAWAAFRELPLTAAEFQTIASNIAPYMR